MSQVPVTDPPTGNSISGHRGRIVALLRGYSDALTSVASSFWLQGTLVVSGVLVARLLGPSDRGHLALLALVPSLLSQVGLCGLPLSLTYFIARRPDATKALVADWLMPIALIPVICMAIQVLILMLTMDGQSHTTRIAGYVTLIAAPGYASQMMGMAILQGMHRFRAFNVLRGLQASLYGLATLALLFVDRFATGIGLIEFAAAWSLSMLISGAIILAWSLRGLKDEAPTTPPPARRTVLRFGLKSLASAFSPTDSLRIDQLAVGVLVGPVGLGYYVVATALTSLPRFVSQSVGIVAYPKVAVERTDPWGAIVRYMALAVVVCGGIVLAEEIASMWLIRTFFGADFGASIGIARVLLFSAFFAGVRSVLLDCVRGAGRPSHASIGEVTSWVVSVPIIIALTLHSGALGTAWSLVLLPLISMATITYLTFRERRQLRLPGFALSRLIPEEEG